MGNSLRILAVAAGTLLGFSPAAGNDISWRDLNMRVASYYFSGQDAKALSTAEAALKAAQAEFGPDHSLVASILTDIGALQRSAKNYTAAETLVRAGHSDPRQGGRCSEIPGSPPADGSRELLCYSKESPRRLPASTSGR